MREVEVQIWANGNNPIGVDVCMTLLKECTTKKREQIVFIDKSIPDSGALYGTCLSCRQIQVSGTNLAGNPKG